MENKIDHQTGNIVNVGTAVHPTISGGVVNVTISNIGGNEKDTHPLPFRPGMKEYIHQKFLEYEEADIAVNTPQLLLMLLTTENSFALTLFNSFKFKGQCYGDYLISVFRYIDNCYVKEGRKFDRRCYDEFDSILRQFTPQPWEGYLSEHNLCYAILQYGGVNTAKMLQRNLGPDKYDSLLCSLKLGRAGSMPVDMDLPEELPPKETAADKVMEDS